MYARSTVFSLFPVKVLEGIIRMTMSSKVTTQLELPLSDYYFMCYRKSLLAFSTLLVFTIHPSCEKAMKKAHNISFISLYTYNTFALVFCDIPFMFSMFFSSHDSIIILLSGFSSRACLLGNDKYTH